MKNNEVQQRSESQIGVFARPTLLTVKQFCQQNPAFTEGGMRWSLFNRQDNGLERAVVKYGRRVLIDVEKFFRWLDEQNSMAKEQHPRCRAALM